ncbi:hypothetical protein LTR84_001289 [Exophiala bonariae]|uniref:Glutamic acid-rich protein n=1 Tax=Exophiala bonariae TaxID=1690606 RepID=A0AAV9NCD2_9EURO|nr:hypothetical protein LTR84_001289 [Exophiala bonariae]
MAKAHKQAAEKPSFSAPAEPFEDSSELDDSSSDHEKKEQAKVVSKKSKKDKKKNKKERKEKKDKKAKKEKKEKTEKQEKNEKKEKKERKEKKDKSDAQEKDNSKDPSPVKSEVKSIAYEVPVESPEAAERREQKNKARRKREAEKKALAEATGKKLEGVQGATKVLAAGLKRKFDDPHSNVTFNSRLDAETQAIKRLRESLPSTRLSLVSQKLEQECGTEPTAMAVLVEAARETILDLARGQMNTMAGGATAQEGLSGAVLRMLNEQKGRLDKLESAVEKPKVVEIQVVKDTNTEVAGEVKDGDVESVHEVPSEEDTTEESSSGDSDSDDKDADNGTDEDDSESETGSD